VVGLIEKFFNIVLFFISIFFPHSSRDSIVKVDPASTAKEKIILVYFARLDRNSNQHSFFPGTKEAIMIMIQMVLEEQILRTNHIFNTSVDEVSCHLQDRCR
jgi:hypothetical protein